MLLGMDRHRNCRFRLYQPFLFIGPPEERAILLADAPQKLRPATIYRDGEQSDIRTGRQPRQPFRQREPGIDERLRGTAIFEAPIVIWPRVVNDCFEPAATQLNNRA